MGEQDGPPSKQELADKGRKGELDFGKVIGIVAISPDMYDFYEAVGKGNLEEGVFWRAEISSH